MLLKRKCANMYTCELTKDMEGLYNYKDVCLMKMGVTTYNILSRGTYVGRLLTVRNIIYQISKLPPGICSKYLGKKIEIEPITLGPIEHDTQSGIKTGTIITTQHSKDDAALINKILGLGVADAASLINIGIEFLNHKPNVPIYWNDDYKLFEIKVNDKMIYAYNIDNFNMVILDDPNIELRDGTGATGRIRFLYDQIVDTMEIHQSSIHNEYKEDIFRYLTGARLIYERKESYPEFCLGKTLDSLLVSRKTKKLISRLFRIGIDVITGHKTTRNKIINLTKIDNNNYKVEGFESNELFLNKTDDGWEYYDTTVSDKPMLHITTKNMIICGIVCNEPCYEQCITILDGYKFDIKKPKELSIKETDIADVYKILNSNSLEENLILIKTEESTLYSIYTGVKMCDYLLASIQVNNANIIDSVLIADNICMLPEYRSGLEALRGSKLNIITEIDEVHDYNWLLENIYITLIIAMLDSLVSLGRKVDLYYVVIFINVNISNQV